MLYQEALQEPAPETMEDSPFASADTADKEEMETLQDGLPTQGKAVVADEREEEVPLPSNEEETIETEAIE